MKLLLLLTVLLSIVDVQAAQPIDFCAGLGVEGESKVKPHNMVKLKATGYDAGAAIVWDVTPDELADVEELGDRLLFAAPPGRYVVKCRAISTKDGKTSVQACRLVVTVGDDPKPAPVKTPPKVGVKPAIKGDPVQATASLRVGSAGCTATVIGPRREDGRWDVVTAAHCVKGASRGKIALKDGRTLSVTRAAIDTGLDICWMITDDVVENLPCAYMADSDPDVGVIVWHNGYGVDKPGNVEHGVVLPGLSIDGMIRFRIAVSSGDSGGGIFRDDTGEWVSAVCCGAPGNRPAPTWGGGTKRAAALRPK